MWQQAGSPAWIASTAACRPMLAHSPRITVLPVLGCLSKVKVACRQHRFELQQWLINGSAACGGTPGGSSGGRWSAAVRALAFPAEADLRIASLWAVQRA